MTRMLALFPLLVSGCIIYEEDWDHGHCRRCETDEPTAGTSPGDDDDDVGGGGGGTGTGTGGDTEPEPDPGPLVTSDLELTEASASPGDSVLSSLVVVSGNIDLGSIVSVGFERDVLVLDQLDRPGEIVLLLSIDAEAAAGEVDVFVETEVGEGYILATPFTILEAAAECTPGTDTGCP